MKKICCVFLVLGAACGGFHEGNVCYASLKNRIQKPKYVKAKSKEQKELNDFINHFLYGSLYGEEESDDEDCRDYDSENYYCDYDEYYDEEENYSEEEAYYCEEEAYCGEEENYNEEEAYCSEEDNHNEEEN